MSTLSPLDTWHRMVRTNDATDLATLVAEDAVFHSPVVHSPQRGRKLTVMYLSAAFQVFFNPTFRYVREIVITWNDAGLITEFKVMIRPLKGVDVVHRKMGEMLQAAQKPAA